MYKVTVCVPVYNAELYLEDCILSLINQTLKDIEIIFVNDGSRDKSLNILNKYSKKYSNIKIINQSNQGLGGARNSALNIAKGEYIGFVDADDFVELDMYEKLYNKAKISDSDIVICDLNFYPKNSSNKKKWFNKYEGEVSGEFLNRNTQATNKIVSNKLVKRINFSFYEKNGDGQYIILMLNANGISTVNEPLYNYRIGHSSMSSDYSMDKFILSIKSCEKQLDLLRHTQYSSSLKEYFDFRMIYVLLQAMLVAVLTDNKRLYYEYRTRLHILKYKKNKYTKTILSKDYGKFKYFSITHILVVNYEFSSFISKILKSRGIL